MARLHIYRKSIIKANYYTDTRAISVFLDDRLIGKMNPGNNMTIEVAPGPHKMVIRPGGLLRFPDTQEFTVDADSTDVYAAFRGRMARYIDPMIFQIYQLIKIVMKKKIFIKAIIKKVNIFDIM